MSICPTAAGNRPLWPFGHGLSFTTFEMQHAHDCYQNQTASTITAQGKVIGSVAVTILNTGDRAGAEVLQLYVSGLDSAVPRPSRELHGFSKVHLQPGEENFVEISIDSYATSFWDEKEDIWCTQSGRYELTVVGTACKTAQLSVPELLHVKDTVRWLGV